MSRPSPTASGSRRGFGFGGGEDVAEGDELTDLVRHLDADGAATGDRGEDAHVGGRHRIGEVVGEAGDPVDLHPGCELELVAGHGRADGHADQVGVDAVLVERLFEHRAGLLGDAPVGFRLGASSQDRGRRQRPPAALGAPGDVEGHLPVGLLDDGDGGQVGLGRLGRGGLVGDDVELEVVELGDARRPRRAVDVASVARGFVGGSGGVVVGGLRGARRVRVARWWTPAAVARAARPIAALTRRAETPGTSSAPRSAKPTRITAAPTVPAAAASPPPVAAPR